MLIKSTYTEEPVKRGLRAKQEPSQRELSALQEQSKPARVHGVPHSYQKNAKNEMGYQGGG